MIDNRHEYQKMYAVESKLWWYKILHDKVLTQIRQHFGANKPDIKILDAACGTGGLLIFLQKNGFINSSGFDFSEHAVEFSLERKLDVGPGDLKSVEKFRPLETYDVICCNDALYFLTDAEILHTLSVFKRRLRPNGIILINIHAFEAFSGTHDLAVGSTRRFVLRDFQKFAKQVPLKISYNTYWPFLLSIPIWAVRQYQKYQIKKGYVQIRDAGSDVNYPGNLINNLLLFTTKAEEILLSRAPWGSSLFMVLK